MSRDTDIWISELAEALHQLDARENAGRRIAEFLGFSIPDDVMFDTSGPDKKTDTEADNVETGATKATDNRPIQTQTTTDTNDKKKPKPNLLTPIEHATSTEEFEWEQGPKLASYQKPKQPRPHIPLFEPLWSHSIIAAIAATKRQSSAIDEQLLVERVARCQPIRQLPRQLHWSLAQPIQVLVDVGQGMDPFARDQMALLEELRTIVGSSQITEYQYSGTPLNGVYDIEDNGLPWEPPEAKNVVIVLSDFGIGNPGLKKSEIRDWLGIAALLTAQGSPIVGVVPYPQNRWPDALARRLTLIEWDRPTRFSMVRQQREKNHK